MFGLGMGELVVILLILLLFFGAKRVPDLASGLGRSINALRMAMRGEDDAGGKGREA